MQEFILILKKDESGNNITFLCSKTIHLDDFILFEHLEKNCISEGKVNNLDIDNQLVKVLCKEQEKIVNLENCFFPIIEVHNPDLEFKHKLEVTRDNLDFLTVCPKCHLPSRKLNDCSEPETHCNKKTIKPYAYIKQKK